ncbi:unnamed protein product [Protopolystoma xenopodis]|uniref:Uncharacterized protein n=1 Tax=Protopolystoma xenopodis TaxID=117903 RepID=A0A448X462_9PLAT|nr:unnamed protein product [Protopolystoma xenopodis]
MIITSSANTSTGAGFTSVSSNTVPGACISLSGLPCASGQSSAPMTAVSLAPAQPHTHHIHHPHAHLHHFPGHQQTLSASSTTASPCGNSSLFHQQNTQLGHPQQQQQQLLIQSVPAGQPSQTAAAIYVTNSTNLGAPATLFAASAPAAGQVSAQAGPAGLASFVTSPPPASVNSAANGAISVSVSMTASTTPSVGLIPASSIPASSVTTTSATGVCMTGSQTIGVRSSHQVLQSPQLIRPHPQITPGPVYQQQQRPLQPLVTPGPAGTLSPVSQLQQRQLQPSPGQVQTQYFAHQQQRATVISQYQSQQLAQHSHQQQQQQRIQQIQAQPQVVQYPTLHQHQHSQQQQQQRIILQTPSGQQVIATSTGQQLQQHQLGEQSVSVCIFTA